MDDAREQMQRPGPRRPRAPLATYRLQLHAGFGFAAAHAVVPYLAALGVGDCYTSPLLAARPGSPHGYDVCDHGALNPELGTAAEFAAFRAALTAHDMGLLVDCVPNHMSIAPAANAWWRDVLEHGRCSPYAAFFDIDWAPVKAELHGKLLLPILGDQYGLVLERGELRVAYAAGAFTLAYFEHVLPLDPRQLPRLLDADLDALRRAPGEAHADVAELLSILTALRNLPACAETDAARSAERQRETAVARERLARLTAGAPTIDAYVAACVARVNAPDGHARLHALLEAQPYRLAYWRTASDEINYRRFFDINELAGLRMEDARVQRATHALLLPMLADGRLTGLRLDHIDGLYDPRGYLDALQAAARAAGATAPPYVVVEKILASGEELPAAWPVAGTTGYDFLNTLNGLFVDRRQQRALARVYRRFSGRREPFAEVLYACKQLIMETSMASELNMLAAALNRLSEHDPRTRDFTLNSLRDVLREIVACLPAYRTYVSAAGIGDGDRRTLDTAIARARRRNPTLEPSIFAFVRAVLLPDGATDAAPRLDFAMKFQQYSGPVEAKGREDTAFYRYVPLLALNEVGGDPERFGCPPSEFHTANQRRLAAWPDALLATATHDTKRGEDARARLDALSELAEEWGRRLSGWARVNAARRTPLDGVPAPDRNDEYLFYQTLLGAWPPGATAAPADLVARVADYMVKAAREAKMHTSWLTQHEAYEAALRRFVTGVLTGRSARRFLDLFLPLQRRVAEIGMVNGLAQLVLKVVSPGVPDFYQGTELWDLALVDPDNRRAVDFGARQRALAALRAGDRPPWPALLRDWADGRIKLLLTATLLDLRRRAACLRAGGYEPLEVRGAHAAHLVALARGQGAQAIVAVVPRLIAGLTSAEEPLPLGACWADTTVALPAAPAARRWRDVCTGALHTPDAGGRPALAAAALCAQLPFAVLAAEA